MLHQVRNYYAFCFIDAISGELLHVDTHNTMHQGTHPPTHTSCTHVAVNTECVSLVQRTRAWPFQLGRQGRPSAHVERFEVRRGDRERGIHIEPPLRRPEQAKHIHLCFAICNPFYSVVIAQALTCCPFVPGLRSCSRTQL